MTKRETKIKTANEGWLQAAFLSAIPGQNVKSVVEWAEKNMRITGSAKTEAFDRTTAPWLNTVMECAMTPGRYTFIKPIQSGGTTLGEIVLCFWLATWNVGDVGYFWPSDAKADDRWLKYTEKRLRACEALMKRAPTDRFKWTKGLIAFPHSNFAQLGVKTDRNVSSDTLRGVINEELHDDQGGWEPGKLEQVYGRQRAVWNAVAFNISNASHVGDQLHQAWQSGTQEEWEIKCPGCGLYHPMRTRWEETKPELGGLRYASEKCRRDDGSYDYNKMAATVRFQMPCGFLVHDTPAERRVLSESGRYSAPNNTGALPNQRSFRLEAVAVHDVNWLELIIQKHKALKALKGGDPSLFEVYQREQECIFWNPASRPFARPIVLSERKKDRAGLPNKLFRFAALDRQLGREGELPHWWALIQDFDEKGNSLIVWEGKCQTDSEAVEVIRRHGVKPNAVVVDSSADTKRVYDFCLCHGFNAIKVTGDRVFTHEDQVPRRWSEPAPLWLIADRTDPVRDNDDDEPEFWLVSQTGALDSLSYLRAGVRRYEVPQDVSEDFKQHFNVWSLEEHRIPATNEIEMRWKKSSERADDHLFMCASYLAVMLEITGLLGQNTPPPKKAA